MKQIERNLIGALVVGIWSLVAIQVTSIGHAQEASMIEQENEDIQNRITVIHATDIVGLNAMIEKSVRDHQFRPQSMLGLDQYVKTIVRNCRISGSVTGDRITSTNISC
jgi:hypothetical protein